MAGDAAFGIGKKKLVDLVIQTNYPYMNVNVEKFTYAQLLFIIQEFLYEEGKQYYEKSTFSHLGLDTFRAFVKHCLYRNIANYDTMLLVEGKKGSGKSSAGMMLAKEWCRLLGIRFAPERHIAYSNADMMRKIDTLEKFEPLLCLAGDAEILIRRKNKIFKKQISKLTGKKDFEVLTYNLKTLEYEYKKCNGAVRTKKDAEIFEVELENGLKIKATKDHPFLTLGGYVQLRHLLYRDEIIVKTSTGKSKIKSIKKLGERVDVFDILAVEDNHNFVANNMVVHNCDEAVRFCSSEDWNRRENKDLKKKIAQIRTKHLFFILCFPLKIYKVEKTYLESYVNYWCLSGDTKINIKDHTGMIRNTPIKELQWKKNYLVLTYNEKTEKYEYKKCNGAVRTKKDAEIFEVELENGLKIKATKDHPFLTARGYIKLEDLTEEDEIIVKTKKCNYCQKEFIPKRELHYCCSKKCNSSFQGKTERAKFWRKINWSKNKEALKINSKEQYIKHKEKRLEEAKKYRIENKDNINAWHKIYREGNRELLRQRDKTLRENDREHQLERHRKNRDRYMRENLNFKIANNLRNGLRRVLKTQNTRKTACIFQYLDCDIDFFKEYIALKFKDNMSWDTWGKTTWHLDHIKPCMKFDLTQEENRKVCFHYTNYQPLLAFDNISKGARYEG